MTPTNRLNGVVATFVAAGVVACVGAPEELPIPSTGSNEESVSACGVPPPPPAPEPILVSSPSSLDSCLPSSWPKSYLPVLVSVNAQGRASALRFESPCELDETLVVPTQVAQCIERRLADWEWLTVTRCSLDEDSQYYYTELAHAAVSGGRDTDWRRKYRFMVDNGRCVGGGTEEP